MKMAPLLEVLRLKTISDWLSSFTTDCCACHLSTPEKMPICFYWPVLCSQRWCGVSLPFLHSDLYYLLPSSPRIPQLTFDPVITS